jgi:uncharacterized protein
MPWFRRSKSSDEEQTTLFFATDLHGSEICWRKFVNAAEFYGADLLVLGGDFTGKLVVPVVRQPEGTWLADQHGRQRGLEAHEIATFEQRMANMGFYPKRMDPDEYDAYRSDPGAVDRLFERLMHERVVNWIEFARNKLEGSGIRIVTAPANDDPYSIDDVLAEHGEGVIDNVEAEVFNVAPGHEMLSSGYTNFTPWNTPREYPEEEIEEHLEKIVEQLDNPKTAIFNLHPPPFASKIDDAPQLNDELEVQTSMGEPIMVPVGSTAVKRVIERHQPLLSLHGHIHESAGAVKIGRTLSINPGSEYGEGVLRGALVTVGGGRILRHQATTG